jgi:hypothetical protein
MRTLSLLGLALSLLLSAPAFAQDEGDKKPAAKEGKVIKLKEISVYGRVRKPEAFYILQRATLSYPEVDLKKSFLGKVVDSVDQNPSF